MLMLTGMAIIRPPRFGRHAFATDFREVAAATDPPTGWTKRWVSTTWTTTANNALPGARGPRVSPGGANVCGLNRDEHGTAVTDCDVVTAVYLSSTGMQAGPVVRGQTGSNAGYVMQGDATGANIQVVKPGVAILQTVAFAYSANTLYFMRLRIQGTTIQGKMWLATSAEPAGWNISTSDASYASGFIGLSGYSANTCDFGWFAAAIGSGVAALPWG